VPWNIKHKFYTIKEEQEFKHTNQCLFPVLHEGFRHTVLLAMQNETFTGQSLNQINKLSN